MHNRSLIVQSTEFAMKVVKNNETVAIYCASTREFGGIKLHVAERNAWK